MIAIRLLCIVAASDDRFADLLALRRPHKEILCVIHMAKEPERVITAGCLDGAGRQGGLPVGLSLAGARAGAADCDLGQRAGACKKQPLSLTGTGSLPHACRGRVRLREALREL